MPATPKRGPSPAVAISLIALFVSLGGTSYAATELAGAHAASKHKAPAPVTAAQVNKLIRSYVAAHHLGATGLQGAAGTPGAPGGRGETGPAGPGAIPISDSVASEGVTQAAALGPWTVSMSCKRESGGAKNLVVEMQLRGPGSYFGTLSIDSTGNESATYNNNGEFGGGQTGAAVGQNGQIDWHGFLTSGSTTYQYSMEFTAKNPLGTTYCQVVGDGIPVS